MALHREASRRRQFLDDVPRDQAVRAVRARSEVPEDQRAERERPEAPDLEQPERERHRPVERLPLQLRRESRRSVGTGDERLERVDVDVLQRRPQLQRGHMGVRPEGAERREGDVGESPPERGVEPDVERPHRRGLVAEGAERQPRTHDPDDHGLEDPGAVGPETSEEVAGHFHHCNGEVTVPGPPIAVSCASGGRRARCRS